MMDAESVRALLAGEGSAADCGDGVRVSTHCLYPSNGMVGVVVRGGDNAFVVSDEGGALQEIGASGRSLASASHTMGRLVRSQGLRVENGSILSLPVTLSELAVAIILVANASKEVADWGLANTKSIPPGIDRELSIESKNVHPHEYLRVKEAAEYIRCSVSNMNKLRCYGTGPAYIKRGRLVLYRRADLDAWLLSQRRRSTSEAA